MTSYTKTDLIRMFRRVVEDKQLPGDVSVLYAYIDDLKHLEYVEQQNNPHNQKFSLYVNLIDGTKETLRFNSYVDAAVVRQQFLPESQVTCIFDWQTRSAFILKPGGGPTQTESYEGRPIRYLLKELRSM